MTDIMCFHRPDAARPNEKYVAKGQSGVSGIDLIVFFRSVRVTCSCT